MGLKDNVFSWLGLTSPEATTTKASKGTVRDSFYSSFGGFRRENGNPGDTNLNIVLDLYKKDPVIQAALETRANAIMASGFTIEGKPTPKKNAEELLKKIKFNYNLLWKIVINGLLYDHVFLEIERTNSGSPVALHVLETTQMEIKHDVHGDIEGYVQRGNHGEEIFFTTEEVVYMKFNSVTSGVWGEVGLKSLFRTVTTKNQIEKFINSLAGMNAWRQVIKTSMRDQEIGEFLSYFYSQSQDPNEPLVVQVQGKDGDVDKNMKFEVLRDPKDLEHFLGTLDYFRTQTLMKLSVPPIMIGLPDSSNRSNSDMQFKAFNIANNSFRNKMKVFITELFEKIGLSTVDFSWNPIDERDEKVDIEIAERLINMGAEPDMVEEFLRDAGLELPEGKLFKKDIDPKKSMDMYPSRQGKAEGEANERIGSGEDGTTRQDQL